MENLITVATVAFVLLGIAMAIYISEKIVRYSLILRITIHRKRMNEINRLLSERESNALIEADLWWNNTGKAKVETYVRENEGKFDDIPIEVLMDEAAHCLSHFAVDVMTKDLTERYKQEMRRVMPKAHRHIVDEEAQQFDDNSLSHSARLVELGVDIKELELVFQS